MEKYITIISGAIGTFVSFLVGGLGEAVTVLLFLMTVDYITGLMSAAYLRELNSRIGFNGLMRKAYYLLLLGAVYAISLVVEGISYAGDGLAIALCIMELVSITENGTKMNLPMPEPVKKLLLVVNKTINGDKEDNSK